MELGRLARDVGEGCWARAGVREDSAEEGGRGVGVAGEGFKLEAELGGDGLVYAGWRIRGDAIIAAVQTEEFEGTLV